MSTAPSEKSPKEVPFRVQLSSMHAFEFSEQTFPVDSLNPDAGEVSLVVAEGKGEHEGKRRIQYGEIDLTKKEIIIYRKPEKVLPYSPLIVSSEPYVILDDGEIAVDMNKRGLWRQDFTR
jgi:hypothetical protein